MYRVKADFDSFRSRRRIIEKIRRRDEARAIAALPCAHYNKIAIGIGDAERERAAKKKKKKKKREVLAGSGA